MTRLEELEKQVETVNFELKVQIICILISSILTIISIIFYIKFKDYFIIDLIFVMTVSTFLLLWLYRKTKKLKVKLEIKIKTIKSTIEWLNQNEKDWENELNEHKK